MRGKGAETSFKLLFIQLSHAYTISVEDLGIHYLSNVLQAYKFYSKPCARFFGGYITSQWRGTKLDTKSLKI